MSAKDTGWARKSCPVLPDVLQALGPFRSTHPTPAPGQQADFEITPDGSRKYQVATFGTADTTLVLFEEDGGEERDSSLSAQLFRGEEVRRARQARMGRTARTHCHHVLVAQRVLHPVP